MEKIKVMLSDGKDMEMSMEDAKRVANSYWRNSPEREEEMKEFAEEYHKRAAKNIQTVAELDECPETEDEVKKAIEKVCKYGSEKDKAEVIYESIEFCISHFTLETFDI